MLKLSSRITFNEGLATELVYTFVNTIEIKSTWAQLTDTCKIIIPKKITLDGKALAVGDSPVFKRGDTVKVELGYDDNLIEVFNGFISKVTLKMPIELECEDQMYALKKKTAPTLSYESTDVKTLVNALNTGVTIDFNQGQNLGKVRVSNNATCAQVLDYLKKEYSIYSFFQRGILRIGRPYYQGVPREHTFGFEKNIISDSLEYMNADDVKVKVRAYGIRTSDNAVVEAYWPSRDAEGEQINIKIDNVGSASDYEALAKRSYDAQQFTGYRGSFTTFGAPFVRHGDIVKLQSDVLKERNGTKYLVKEVSIKFGVNGYRQEVTLDRAVLQ